MKLFLVSLLFVPLFLFANIGTISGVKGKATIHRATKLIEVKNAVSIKVKDSITTEQNAKVQVIMKDKTIITIGENSEYSFDVYTYGDGQEPKVSMELKRGFFRAITGEMSKIAPKRFHIKTRSATIGIRGTHFYGSIRKDEEKITCISGKVIVFTRLKNYLLLAGNSVTLHNGLWNISTLPKAPKAKRHENSKELKHRDILINNTQNVNINSGSISTPTDTPSYNPDL